MGTQKILAEIQKLPLDEQRELLEALKQSVGQQMASHKPVGEDEVDRVLLEKGIIGNIPDLAIYSEEDEDFEPVEVTGKPVSETIIEERR